MTMAGFRRSDDARGDTHRHRSTSAVDGRREAAGKMSSPALETAFRQCWQIAVSHYENFSVGSRLLPRALRRHVAVIYAFARTADDIADEGTRPPGERLAQLDAWAQALEQCYAGHATHPIFIALAHTAAIDTNCPDFPDAVCNAVPCSLRTTPIVRQRQVPRGGYEFPTMEEFLSVLESSDAGERRQVGVRELHAGTIQLDEP